MHVTSEGRDRLIITHDSSGWARVLGGIALVLFVVAGWRYFREGASEHFVGSLGGACTCLLMAAVMFERSRFVVDGRLRQVEWRRQRALRATHGSFSFTQVKAVAAECPLGDDTDGGMRRVVFRTDRGDVPITIGYLPDAHDVAVGLALKLRLMFGLHSEEEPIPSTVRTLAESGRDLEAIKLLRAERGVSLADAHSAVKAIRRSRR